jgi:uncharacterized protein YegL
MNNDIGYSVNTFDGDTFFVKDLSTAKELVYRLLIKNKGTINTYLDELETDIQKGRINKTKSFKDYVLEIVNDDDTLDTWDIHIIKIQFTTIEQINNYFPL